MVPYEYKEEFKYLTHAVINTTDDCNLCCKYCFVHQHPQYMSLQTGIDIIEYIAKNHFIKEKINSFDKSASIGFFGGEPLLNFDKLIQPMILYSENKGYKIKFSITDNGTLLTKDKVDFFKDHNVGILLSIDGNKQTQDFNRPCKDGTSSFDKIISNLPYLLEKNPDIVFRSTIYAPTVQYWFENYLFAEKYGFKNYFCTPDVISTDWTEEQTKELEKQMRLIYEYRILQFQNGITPLHCDRIDTYFRHIVDIIKNDITISQKDFDQNPLWRCGLGTGLGSIGYDGNIYACQEWASKPNEVFYLGNIYKDGIEQEKQEKVLKLYYNALVKGITNDNNTCNEKDCEIYKICKGLIEPRGFCHSWNYNGFQDFSIRHHSLCNFDKLMFKHSIATFELLLKENNEFFKTYLKNLKKPIYTQELEKANSKGGK